MPEQTKTDFVDILGLWESRKGGSYTSQVLTRDQIVKLLDMIDEGPTKVLVSRNKYKQEDKHPDLRLVAFHPDPPRRPLPREDEMPF